MATHIRRAIAYDCGQAVARTAGLQTDSWWVNVPRPKWTQAYEAERKRMSSSREYLKIPTQILMWPKPSGALRKHGARPD